MSGIPPFHLPNVAPEQQLACCLRIITAQRQELIPLRKQLHLSHLQKANLTDIARHWREKYEKAEDTLEHLRKENDALKKEKETLREEIAKLTASNAALAKTNNRYQVALFDHGNYTHPGDTKKKPKGGQQGHANTNTDATRNTASFHRQRLFAATCGCCGLPLARTGASKEKTLIDIQLAPKLTELIVQSERQWCGGCRKEVRAQHPQSLPFTEYGMNTFMVVLYLRYKGKQSVRTIAITLHSLFGLPITKSGVGSLLRQAKAYLQEKYDQLKQAIRDSAVMYNDETGWMVRGKSAWMWIMATADKQQADGSITPGMTVYVPAESRGKGIFKEMYGNSKAKAMHDGYAVYAAVTGDKDTLYCWSHVLRFCFEETVHLDASHLACQIRDKLVTLYQTIRIHKEWTREHKEGVLRTELDGLISIESTDTTVQAILHRLTTQKEGLIQALLITEDGTNNLAEREFRELAISRNISFGSDTYTGMETTAILASVVKTIGRDTSKPFLQTLTSSLQEGIKKKHFRYKHTPVCDI